MNARTAGGLAVMMCATSAFSGSNEGVAPPFAVAPVHLVTTVDQRPEFLWNGRFEADGYLLELWREGEPDERRRRYDSGFDVSATDPATSIAPKVRFRPTDSLEEGGWRWRVGCVAAATGREPAWGVERRFAVAATDEDAIAFCSPLPLARPYLHFGPGGVDRVRERAATDPRFAAGLRRLTAEADLLTELSMPKEDYARSTEGQHERYSVIGGMTWSRLGVLGMAWQLTGDRRYADAARDVMLTVAGYERWVGEAFLDPTRFDPPWKAALETAMTTYGMAVGYDWVWDALSPAERETIRDAIVTLGIEPLMAAWVTPETAARIPRHQAPGGNWAMVCAGSAGVGALTMLGEDPRAEAWARAVRDRVRWWLHYDGGEWTVDWPYGGERRREVIGPDDPNFGPDGGYRESIGYMHYAMLFVNAFADALEGVSDEDLFAHVPPTLLDPIVATLYACDDSGRAVERVADFGDSGGSPAFSDLYACLMANAPDPLGGVAAALHDRIVAAVPTSSRSMIWYDADRPRADLSLPRAGRWFRGTGVAALRIGGASGAHAALKTRQNRGHHDIGAIYYYSAGETWITDSGTFDYASSIYRDFLSRTEAQNLVQIDGRLQRRVDGEVQGFVAGLDYGAVRCDAAATDPETLESWTRQLVMIGEDLLVVIDRLRGRGEHRYEWLLHPGVPYRVDPGRNVRLIGRTDTMTVTVAFPTRWRAQERDGYQRWVPRTYLAIGGDEAVRDEDFVVVFSRDTGPAGPAVVVTEGTAIRIRRADLDLRIDLEPGGETNGSTGAIQVVNCDPETGRWRSAAVHGGSAIVPDGAPLLAADGSIDAVVERHGEAWVVAVDAPTTRTIEMGPEVPAGAFRAGADVDRTATDSGDLVRLHLGAGVHELVFADGEESIQAALRRPAHAPIVRDHRETPAYAGTSVRVSSLPAAIGTAAIDGSPMTNWHSLPGIAPPHWVEVRPPTPTAMSRIRICPTHREDADVEVRCAEDAPGEWTAVGRIENAPPDRPVEFEFDRRTVEAVRVTIPRTTGSASIGGLWELSWR